MKKRKLSLDYILYPSSIAVIGASGDPFKWGSMLLSSILNGGFNGKVYPINPTEDEVKGLKCYPRVTDVPEAVDLAIVVVPLPVVPQVIGDCVEKGVRGAVIITSGFSEAGEEGKRLQEEIVRIAKKGGIRLVGPNCMGICSSPSKLSALMIPFLYEGGNVAFISQSGGYGMQLYLRAMSAGVGISKFISSGNEADLTCTDYLEYFAEDEEVRLIALYLEGIRNGRRFLETAREVVKKKPIVVIKVGRTEMGSRAAASHTGAIAGSDRIYDAAFKQAGVIRTSNAEEMFDVIKALLYCPLPKGNRIGVITNSGGIGVETADSCVELGFQLPELPSKTQEEIMRYVPPFANPRNPVDITASLNMEAFLKVPEIVLADENIDAAITLGLGISVMQTLFPGTPREAFLQIFKSLSERLIGTYKKSGKPVLVINPAADIESEAVKILEESGVPVYLTPERAAKAMAALYRYKLALDRLKAVD